MSGARLRPGVDGAQELVLDGKPDPSSVAALVEEAFGSGTERVEVRVDLADVTTLRALSRAGLRREGVLRAPGGGRRALMARVAGDPAVGSHEGFIAMLNAGLPTKRVIAQGLIHDDAGRVLLCELTYKREWDLPGGVIEPGESPADGLVRELDEELGTTFVVQGLRTVNWLAPWRQWDDACVFVFDLGTVAADATRAMTLQPTEIAAVHWCDAHTVADRAAAATATLLADLGAGSASGSASYRERGLPRP